MSECVSELLRVTMVSERVSSPGGKLANSGN